MAGVTSAEEYAAQRVGIFFPASSNDTNQDGDLTGQCVSLTKWFLAENTSVANPFTARGDARYVGKNLVAQGFAVEVSYDQRQSGDIVCYEFGDSGHIAVVLSGGRVFEENVNWGQVKSRRIYSGGTSWLVYSSRIGSESESWRTGLNPHIYRINSYQGGDMNAVSKEAYDQLAHAGGFAFGSNFNYDPNISADNLAQLIDGQIPLVTEDDENLVADGFTGIKNVIGWNGYNSPHVGKPRVTEYPLMVADWSKRAADMKSNAAKPTPSITKDVVLKYVTDNLK